MKTGLWGLRPGPTLTGMYSHRRWIEASRFGVRTVVDESFGPCSGSKGAIQNMQKTFFFQDGAPIKVGCNRE